ncbi:HNH endonuclease signature motif containing protein [Pseudonocardia acaciae]|uniref:HNH endonuclease signature motif containing protein n=1 Tax=Pseudonocardia acaciae TaxID=551276 RepID=UPI0014707F6A|nr:HNH endonuclease signature motif containing protein [Pseudonocardia acaciae]
MDTAELETELVALSSRIASAQCRFLQMLAEFDARDGWAGPGIRSCAHWLSWRVGLSRRTGREQLRVARALRSLPLIVEAFGGGRLSYAKVRAITRIATPGTERALLDLALAGTASHVERAVSATRAATTPAPDRTAARAVSWRWDRDGYLVLRAKLPAEEGARLVSALEARMSGARPTARPTVPGAEPSDDPATAEGGSAEPPAADETASRRAALEHAPGAAVDRLAARRADAMLELLAPDSGQHEVIVHVEVATGAAMLDDGPPVASSTAERLACDARVRTLIKDRTGNPLYLGRGERLVSRTQLAALRIRDRRRCQFPGCDHRRFLHAHHIVHWWRGGRTDLDNLVLLCSFHHRLVHDHPYRLERRGNRLRVWRADGAEVTAQRPMPGVGAAVLTPLDLWVEQHVDDEAIVPSWTGERLDVDAFLAAVLPDLAAA